MRTQSIQAIIQALNDSGVRYLVVGGLAVVAHGYVRFTADVDLILDLEDGNLKAAMQALASLGFRPRAPVPFEDFVDAEIRTRWVKEKGLTVFSLNSPQHPATEIDLFVESPLNFTEAYRSALRVHVTPTLGATFIGLEDLIALKQSAGRPQDLADVQKLKTIRRGTQP